MEIIRRPVPDAAASLAIAGVHPVLARLYAARGIASADELDLDLAQLPPFTMLKGIDDAATRLADAVQARERIVIVADYDADGATACAAGVHGLRAMGADVDFIVPNRFEYGYGLTPEIVELAAAKVPRLIVTVDNGIASHDGVAAAVALGIDVLITDHHLPAATLPAPALIVNPNQPGCEFPSKHLAGVGVMFYVLAATRARLRERRISPSAQSRTSVRCSISSRSAPWLTSCGSTASTERSSPRVSRAFAPAARRRASPRCSRWRAATRDTRARSISASSPVRVSMLRAGWTT